MLNLFFIKLYCPLAHSWTIVFLRLFIKEAKINAQFLACLKPYMNRLFIELVKKSKNLPWERDVLVGVPNWVTLADPRVDWFESCISQKCCATTWIVLTHSGMPRFMSFVGSSESGQWSHEWDSFLFIIKKKKIKKL